MQQHMWVYDTALSTEDLIVIDLVVFFYIKNDFY